MAWSLGSLVGSALGAGVGEAIGKAATPFTEAWSATKKAQSDSKIVNMQTDRDMTIASFQADVQLGLSQRLLAQADATHWSTRWIRPAFAGLAFIWIAASLYFWMMDKVFVVEIDPVVKYLLAGIVTAIFVIRPYEKGKRTDLATASLTQTPLKPTMLQKLMGKKVS